MLLQRASFCHAGTQIKTTKQNKKTKQCNVTSDGFKTRCDHVHTSPRASVLKLFQLEHKFVNLFQVKCSFNNILNINTLEVSLTIILLQFYTCQVKWRPVLWGMALQFIMGLFILRTKVGFLIFDFLGTLVQKFMNYTDKGAMFVFGSSYTDHFFAFKVSLFPSLFCTTRCM